MMTASGRTYTAAGLVIVWLVLGALTAAGARHRGQRWRLALVSGLLFPIGLQLANGLELGNSPHNLSLISNQGG